MITLLKLQVKLGKMLIQQKKNIISISIHMNSFVTCCWCLAGSVQWVHFFNPEDTCLLRLEIM